MYLYLIRHGLAGEGDLEPEADRARPLTPEGQRKTRRVAQRLVALNIQVQTILTSPLPRAAQTAEILKQENLGLRLETVDFLAPGGSYGDACAWLHNWRSLGGGDVAWVGHQPELGGWAETLVWGHAQDRLVLKKAGVVGLSFTENDPAGRALLFWLTPPRLLL
ncbi:MAG: phosphohistidine phosphatase SixA [Gloeomargaritaceae cyanobacterium C42_A2020_066]|nr:phosphohistidine phosphatase SixA [Gloeomargaritaceae cyanobacterium C42_A2020_066]